MRKVAAAIALTLIVSLVGVTDAQVRRHKKATLRSGAVRTASGLTYLVTEKGKGRLPKKGETVVVHYTGTLTSGAKFDSSLDRGEPIAFKLGAGRVIKGWDEGIAKLHIGDRAILVIPAKLGYGAKGAGGVIPPNATLIFVVELVDIRGPSLAEMLFEVNKASGGAAMLARYRELKQGGFKDIYHSESDLNGLGYQLLAAKQVADAIEVFKLIVEEYPRSANAYDSLGEAYVAAGQRGLAIDSYTKALEIDPKFPSAIKALEKLKSDQ
jgi:hypothetical protein